ncbi:MAG: TRAP transporter substrate-binding protein DctP [Candidatus Ornithospirochaeta sp.]|nr:TRAP transporter substrate-binding protein DctP [Spirochaetales bacterium]
MKKILLCLLSIFLLFSCAKNNAEKEEPLLILRYGDNQPDYYPTTRAARYFSQLVEERSGGRIEIEVYGDGKLGNENDVFRMVEYGGVDFMRLSIGTLSAFYPEFQILQLPYLFSSSEHMWKVLDGEVGEYFLSILNGDSIGLSWFDAGARSVYTIDKIDTLSDLDGKVIRTQENDKMEEIFSLLCASTIQIPYGSVYSELMKKTIDGAENNFPSYMYTGHSDVARFVFLDEHMRLPEIMIMSRKAMEEIAEIDESLLVVIKEAAIEAGLFERELWREEEEKAKRDAIIKGCVVTYPSFDELEKWKDAVSPIYDSLDPESKRIVEEIKSLDQ